MAVSQERRSQAAAEPAGPFGQAGPPRTLAGSEGDTRLTSAEVAAEIFGLAVSSLLLADVQTAA